VQRGFLAVIRLFRHVFRALPLLVARKGDKLRSSPNIERFRPAFGHTTGHDRGKPQFPMSALGQKQPLAHVRFAPKADVQQSEG
jgi:hypothetical protein